MNEETPNLCPVFVANVRAELARKRMKISELAEACDMHAASVSRILSGRTSPNLGTIARFAAALGVEAYTLLKPR